MTFKYIRCYETNEYWSIEDYEKDFELYIRPERAEEFGDDYTFDDWYSETVGGNGLCDSQSFNWEIGDTFEMLIEDEYCFRECSFDEFIKAWANYIPVRIVGKYAATYYENH